MPWFKLDDHFTDHPKVVRAGPEAGWLFVAGGLYCARYLTDGWIPREIVPRLTSLKRPMHLAGILVAVELWHESREDYFEVHDYLDYNPSRAESDEKAVERSAKASHAARARWDARANAPSIPQASNQDAQPVLDPMLENAPYPYPYPSSNSSIGEKLEADFDELWQGYPRKEARKDALKAYLARRREGVEYGDLERAIGNYAQSAVGKERNFIMLGSTFFGPNERWRDFLELPPDMAGKIDDAAYWRQFKTMIPEAVDCEQIVLAACFVNGGWRQQTLAALTLDDFHDPRNAQIFAAIASLNGHGIIADRDTVAAELGDHGLRQIGGVAYLEHVDRQTPVTLTAYLKILAGAGDRRRLMGLLEKAALDVHDPDTALGEVTAALTRDLETVQHPEFAPAMTVEEYLAEPDAFDWIIPRLLEVGDRVMWTASEGAGKSTLQLQLAVMAAAGIHPFRRYPIRALRVLYVDLENSPRQTARSLRALTELAHDAGDDVALLLMTPPRTAGIDLRNTTDFAWLDRYCALHDPELIVIGPLYKCFRPHGRESKVDETAAEECVYALDRLRERYQCALSVEAHAPHGDSGDRAGLRPYGASLWLRWPEFGFGLKRIPNDRDVEVVPWRGPCDRDRDWPEKLLYGALWPWEIPDQGSI